MWIELNSEAQGEEKSTTWVDLSKAGAITVSRDKATIAIGGETYRVDGEKDVERIQNWLLRKKQSQSS